MSPAQNSSSRRVARLLAAALCCACVALGVAGLASGQTVDSLHSKIDAAKSRASSLGADVQAKVEAAAQAHQEAAAAAAREAQLSSVLARGQEREAELPARV